MGPSFLNPEQKDLAGTPKKEALIFRKPQYSFEVSGTAARDSWSRLGAWLRAGFAS